MSTTYNSQLDAFELYHLVQEPDSGGGGGSSSSHVAAALGHALSGATGAAISNVLTYPLDLIITRLQIQRQMRKESGADGTEQNGEKEEDEHYKGFSDAVRKIVDRDGYMGLWRGVDGDTVKTVLDVGGFFLVYSFLRGNLSKRREGGRLGAAEELAVGWVSGAMVKAVVMPCNVVVAKAQTRGMGGSGGGGGGAGLREIAREIRQEKGLKGFWAGYQAAMLLTLNPSLTFMLHTVLNRSLPRSLREKPGAVTTFLLSASSKAIASAIMYPFSLAKTRLMVGGKKEEAYEKEVEEEVEGSGKRQRLEKEVLQDTLLSTLIGIVENEGYSGLYEGLHLEMCKGFLSHGITMMVKQIVQRFIVKMWYIFGVVMRRYRRKLDGTRLRARARENVEYFNLAMARAGERVEGGVKEAADWSKEKANETAEFVHEYVEEETEEWRSLYGELDLSRWLTEGRKDSK